MKRSSKLWTKEQDRTLKQFAESDRPWVEVIALLPGRTVAACQTRWLQRLKDPVEDNKKHGDNRFREERHTGEAIGGEHYIFKVPDGDPLLQRLIAIHGNDNRS